MICSYKENPDHFVHSKGGTLEEQRIAKETKLDRVIDHEKKTKRQPDEDITKQSNRKKKTRKFY